MTASVATMLRLAGYRIDQRLDRKRRLAQIGSMPALHITKVAVGCKSIEELQARQAARASDGEVALTTRYRPTRHAELIGGSIYWIIKHRLAVRQRILGFEEAEGGRWHVRLDARLVPVRARPKRAHQGWRYLKGEDAPTDFDGDEGGLADLPPAMISDLARLALI